MNITVDKEAEEIIARWAAMGCYIYLTPNNVNIAVRNIYEGTPEEDNVGWAVRCEWRGIGWVNVTAYNWNLSDAVRATEVLFQKKKAEGEARREADRQEIVKLRQKLGLSDKEERQLVEGNWKTMIPPPPLPRG